MALRKECICGHSKNSHSCTTKFILKGNKRTDNVGKCRVPNCNCKGYLFKRK